MMHTKAILLWMQFSIAATSVNQSDPVTWSFSARKVADKIYEIHFSASIKEGWHLYSQEQPDDAIAIPTNFKINNNPLLTMEGKIKEDGAMEKFHDAKLEISAHQYSGKVDFVQVIKIKANVKTNLSGSLQYQTCDDKKCLPPKTVTFNIPIK